jgi:hypothetical protein
VLFLFFPSRFINFVRSGTMAKIPKKSFKEVYNEINYYKVDFPDNATIDEKGLLLGSSILINALYFEHTE